ncbi:MAG: hypothetical protein SPJ92_09060 [Bariatricus sp.]|nr:hypothetical protein [Bariatricus sp.]
MRERDEKDACIRNGSCRNASPFDIKWTMRERSSRMVSAERKFGMVGEEEWMEERTLYAVLKVYRVMKL